MKIDVNGCWIGIVDIWMMGGEGMFVVICLMFCVDCMVRSCRVVLLLVFELFGVISWNEKKSLVWWTFCW